MRDLSDPAFADEFEAHLRRRQVVRRLAVARAKADLSQAELAAKLGWSQSKVSKLENGTDDAASVGDLKAFADAVGERLVLTVEPRDKPSTPVTVPPARRRRPTKRLTPA